GSTKPAAAASSLPASVVRRVEEGSRAGTSSRWCSIAASSIRPLRRLPSNALPGGRICRSPDQECDPRFHEAVGFERHLRGWSWGTLDSPQWLALENG